MARITSIALGKSLKVFIVLSRFAQKLTIRFSPGGLHVLEEVERQLQWSLSMM